MLIEDKNLQQSVRNIYQSYRFTKLKQGEFQKSWKNKGRSSREIKNSSSFIIISGYINAFTYNNAGELFAGAQTGNVIFMALHFAKGNFEKAV